MTFDGSHDLSAFTLPRETSYLPINSVLPGKTQSGGHPTPEFSMQWIEWKSEAAEEEVKLLKAALRRLGSSAFAKTHHAHVEAAKAASIPLKFSGKALEAARLNFDIAWREFEGSEPTPSLDESLTNDEISDFIELKLRRAFASIADDLLEAHTRVYRIGSEGGFRTEIGYEISKRFNVSSLIQQDFSDSIFWSIFTYINNGGKISGDWGILTAVGKNLYMKIEPYNGAVFVDDDSVSLSFVEIP